MLPVFRAVSIVVLSLLALTPAWADGPWRVGIYAGPGTDAEDREALVRAIPEVGLEVREVSADGLKAALAELDVLVVGGGSGTKLARGLGDGRAEAIEAFVKAGGGYVGAGAGAYLAVRGYNADTRCLELVDARVVDPRGWKRGAGVVTLEPLTEDYPRRWEFQNGPLLAPGRSHAGRAYEPLARFVTDLQAEDEDRQGLMPGTHAIARAAYGKGRAIVFSVLPHRRAETVPALVDAICWAAGDGPPAKAAPRRPAKGALRVAILDDQGCIDGCVAGSFACFDAARGFWVRRISGRELAAGVLADYDVVVLPGGSATSQSGALGAVGREKLKEFVARGGGYVGVCAGAYLAASEPSRYGLGLAAVRVVDTKHWKRGSGPVELKAKEGLSRITGQRAKTLTMLYANGPLLEAMDVEGLPAVEPLAVFRSDMAKHGAPAGVMPGKLASLATEYREGRVILFSTHPELTEGLGEMLAKAALWAGRR